MNKNLKKTITVLLICWGFGILISAMITVLMMNELSIMSAFATPVDIQNEPIENFDEIKAVNTTFQMAFGDFSSDSSRHLNSSRDSYVTYTDLYFAVAIDNGGKRYYLAVYDQDDERGAYDKLRNVTKQYLNGDESALGTFTHSVKGSFELMDEYTYSNLQN